MPFPAATGGLTMLGRMQDQPLLISALIDHAAINHGTTAIVSVDAQGAVTRSDWRGVRERARKVAAALERLGVGRGERVATLAWNNMAHLELYFGVTGAGIILHTVNPRLFAEQIRYIVDHGGSRLVFVDPSLWPIARAALAEVAGLRFVLLCDAVVMPEADGLDLLCYETLLAGEDGEYGWPQLDENSGSTLCYTSGTTGNPKGVLYSHRSTILHAFCGVAADGMALSARDSILLATPLFHVNAWGVPFSAAMCGAKLVLPGPKLDGKSLYELLKSEGCTFTLGVPTLWLGLFEHIEAHASDARTVLKLNRLVVGGSAAPRALIEKFDRLLGVELIHAWGMTETSPLATVNRPLAHHDGLDDAARHDLGTSQGRAIFGVELRVVDPDGGEAPRDGATAGDLMVRGPWIAQGYYGEAAEATDAGGWFPTGDVARITPDGFLQITDRSKDVIKSGGEWISSIELENAAVGYPDVAEAAVIGIPHPRWQERPLMLVRLVEGRGLDRAALLDHLAGHVARWWLPDDILAVEALPHTATGKLLKTALRATHRDHFADA